MQGHLGDIDAYVALILCRILQSRLPFRCLSHYARYARGAHPKMPGNLGARLAKFCYGTLCYRSTGVADRLPPAAYSQFFFAYFRLLDLLSHDAVYLQAC